MGKIVRFGVSIKEDLLQTFDAYVGRKGYPTRSKAIADLVREELKRESLTTGDRGTGAIILVYDHHKRALVSRLTDIQHDYHDLVICNETKIGILLLFIFEATNLVNISALLYRTFTQNSYILQFDNTIVLGFVKFLTKPLPQTSCL